MFNRLISHTNLLIISIENHSITFHHDMNRSNHCSMEPSMKAWYSFHPAYVQTKTIRGQQMNDPGTPTANPPQTQTPEISLLNFSQTN